MNKNKIGKTKYTSINLNLDNELNVVLDIEPENFDECPILLTQPDGDD